MKNRIVIKFGGTSLMTPDRIKDAAKIVAATASRGTQVVVVVSAMGHTTDELLRLSDQVTMMPDERELDALLATGEQVSATLMTMSLQALQCKARSFNGAQARITTNEDFGNALIETVDTKALLNCLKNDCIPVVTGFQGMSATGEITTLGRGGSDTTAIALAAALSADRCDIYTDVDGIYSADPRIVRTAFRLDAVPISEMLELAKNGAQVLNARSVEMARDRRIEVRVRSTFKSDDEGAIVADGIRTFRSFTGAATRTNIDCIEIDLERLELDPSRSLSHFRMRRDQTKKGLLKKLSDVGIEAQIVSPVKPNPFRILMIADKNYTMKALAILRDFPLEIREMKAHTDLASISLVATEVTSKHERDALSALSRNRIPVIALCWHRQRLTLLVPVCLHEQACNILHALFVEIAAAA